MSTEEPLTGAMSPEASQVESRTGKTNQDGVTAAKDATVPVKSNQPIQIPIPPVAPAPPGRITSKTKRSLWITAATTVFFLCIAIASFLLFRRAPTQTAASSSAPVTVKPSLPEPTANPPQLADVL